jgi:hypothetical protein
MKVGCDRGRGGGDKIKHILQLSKTLYDCITMLHTSHSSSQGREKQHASAKDELKKNKKNFIYIKKK